MIIKIIFTVLFTLLFGALMIIDFDSWLNILTYIAYLAVCLWLVWGIG